MKMFIVHLLIFLSLILSCTKYVPVVAEPPVLDPPPDSIPSTFNPLLFETNKFNIWVHNNGYVSQAEPSYPNDEMFGAIYGFGLWAAGYQDGEINSNIVGVSSSLARSNYTSIQNEKNYGVFYIDDDSLKYNNYSSLNEVHFPSNIVNKPNGFTWTGLFPDSTVNDPILADPFSDILLTQMLWGHTENIFTESVLFEYTFYNESNANLSDIYLGAWSDLDITYEKVAYDSLNSITYTYSILPHDPDSNYYVYGYTMLEIVDNNSNFVGVTSHRVMVKNDHPEYGEDLNAQSVHYALQGLTNDGNPMINPVTNLPTKFAFTGNPITGEGWIDEGRDVRSLISSGSFEIVPNGWVNIVGVITAAKGETLELAINKLRETIISIKHNRGLWDLH